MRERRFCLCGTAIVLLVTTLSDAADLRIWVDATGKHQTEALLIEHDGESVTLRRIDGNTVRVPLHRLSEDDRRYIASISNVDEQASPPDSSATQDRQPQSEIEITTYRAIDQIIKQCRNANDVLELLDGFLASDELAEEDRQRALDDRPEWEELARKGAIRIGARWLTPDEARDIREQEIQLIREAHRLIDVKHDDLARDKFLEASKINPQEVRADFYLALLNALVAHHPISAEAHFSECAKRLRRDTDLLVGTRRANYVATLNNQAIAQVRLRRYAQAIANWRTALEIAPHTPELVQNLGLLTKLARTSRHVRMSRPHTAAAGDLYAKTTVANSLARFDDNVGWLFIPYIDTFDGAIDPQGDEEFVTVAWCTGFSIGGEFVVTSRYPLADADRIAVRDGADTFSAASGKLVSIADASNLAVLRIDGLNGTALALAESRPKPADDVTIIGYREPGFGADTLQSRTATIVELPNVLRLVKAGVARDVQSGAAIRMRAYSYRDMVMHDVVTNAGIEGAPVFDRSGKVVAIHIGNRPNFATYGSKHSLAEPIQFAIPLLANVVPEVKLLATSQNNEEVALLPNLDERLSGSVFQLAAQRRAPRLAWSHRIEELHRKQKQGTWTSYEDKTCMACNGRMHLNCPGRGCTRGVIRRTERELKHRDQNTGAEIWGNRVVTEKCRVCNGTGTVRCHHCVNGIDKML